MMDQTPIYDIKPYLPYVDAHPEASGGFAHKNRPIIWKYRYLMRGMKRFRKKREKS